MWMREVSIEDGKYSVSAAIVRCGKDIALTVGGGECPHLGASALAIPRPSLSDPMNRSASTSVLCVTGHKEDEFARRAAEQLAAMFNCIVNVNVGVHIECATSEELKRLAVNLEELLSKVVEQLRN